MDPEKRNATPWLIVAGILIIGGLAWWLWPQKTQIMTPPNDTSVSTLDHITAHHFWKDGTHTLEGRITLPTPCHTFSSQVLIAESYPEQITVAFTVAPGAGVCVEMIAEKPFSISFKASKDAIIRATLNGQSITLDLIEQGDVKGDSINKL